MRQVRRQQQPVVVAEPPAQRACQFLALLAQLARASFARVAGSVVPASSASSIARPDSPMTLLATPASLLGCSYGGRVACYPRPVEAAGTQPGRVASGPTGRNIWDG